MPLQMFVYPVRNGTPLPKVFQQFAEVVAQPVTAAAGRDRRAPRPVDQPVDRHRAAVSTRRPGRSRATRCSRVPARRSSAVFFAYPVATHPRARARAGRRTSTSRRSRTCSPTAGSAGSCGSRSGRPRSSTVLTLSSALPGAYVLARLRVPRQTARARAGDGALRAAHRGRRLARSSRSAWSPSLGAILLAHVFFNYAVVVRDGRRALGAPRPAPGGGGAGARRVALARVPRR